jgi:hypothetical protein
MPGVDDGVKSKAIGWMVGPKSTICIDSQTSYVKKRAETR